MALVKYHLIYKTGVKEQLEQDLEKKIFTRNDLIVLMEWVRQIKKYGPDHIRKENRWRDHTETKGKYADYRSSSLGVLQKRIIYDVQDGKIIIVEIIKIEAFYYNHVKGK